MRGARAIWLLLVGCAIHLGCDPELEEPSRKATVTAAVPRAKSQAPKRKQVIAPIAWPDPALIDAGARKWLSSEALAVVNRAALPLLVPATPQALRQAKLMAKAHWFALSSRFDGLVVALSGSRSSYRYSHLTTADGPARVRSRPAFVGHNVGIWSVSWRAHGAAYAIDLECVAAEDPRCSDERFLLELADTLRYVGGAGQGGKP